MFYIYILYSTGYDRYYVGHTDDVMRRLNEHNHPEVSTKFTSKYLPWELKLSFSVSTKRGEAIRVEKFIKNQKSKVFLQKLISEEGNENYYATLINNVLIKVVRAIPRIRD